MTAVAEPLRVTVLGGVPPVLGGGGLEHQARETVAALGRRGHEAFFAAREPAPRPFDLLHAFGSEPDTWQWLDHWRRNPAPLVVSPVLVIAPGRERREQLVARVPLRSWGPRMRAEIVRRADLVVAQTAHEQALLERLGAARTVLVPNGVDADVDRATAGETSPEHAVPDGYVLLLGTVSPRKRQQQTVERLAGTPTVIAGGFDGSAAERRAFEAAVARAGATWLGEVADRGTVLDLLRGARALVHLSQAEGQSLALLESLAVGTPIVVSRLPANAELAARYPELVRIVDRAEDAPAAIAALGPGALRPAAIPRWDDVAAELDGHYREVVDRWRRERGPGAGA